MVKGGEDVRMDERMEQMLHVANGLLARHPGAASHALQVPVLALPTSFIWSSLLWSLCDGSHAPRWL